MTKTHVCPHYLNNDKAAQKKPEPEKDETGVDWTTLGKGMIKLAPNYGSDAQEEEGPWWPCGPSKLGPGQGRVCLRLGEAI